LEKRYFEFYPFAYQLLVGPASTVQRPTWIAKTFSMARKMNWVPFLRLPLKINDLRN
jgi:hypothetical protein